MAAIDKIYGTQKQYNELRNWLLENQKPIRIAYDYNLVTINGVLRKRNIIYKKVLPTDYLYDKNGYDKLDRPIANFPEKIDKWLLKNCKIEWLINKIKEQYNLKNKF